MLFTLLTNNELHVFFFFFFSSVVNLDPGKSVFRRSKQQTVLDIDQQAYFNSTVFFPPICYLVIYFVFHELLIALSAPRHCIWRCHEISDDVSWRVSLRVLESGQAFGARRWSVAVAAAGWRGGAGCLFCEGVRMWENGPGLFRSHACRLPSRTKPSEAFRRLLSTLPACRI